MRESTWCRVKISCRALLHKGPELPLNDLLNWRVRIDHFDVLPTILSKASLDGIASFAL